MICIVNRQYQKLGLTGTGHAAQEQEPDALETVDSRPVQNISDWNNFLACKKRKI